jgi:hypothetical protein
MQQAADDSVLVYKSLTSGLLGSASVETTHEVTVKLVQLTH